MSTDKKKHAAEGRSFLAGIGGLFSGAVHALEQIEDGVDPKLAVKEGFERAAKDAASLRRALGIELADAAPALPPEKKSRSLVRPAPSASTKR